MGKILMRCMERTHERQVFVNCGHGAQGWTSCSATGDVLSRLALAPSRGQNTSDGSDDNTVSELAILDDDVDASTRELLHDLAHALRPTRFEEAIDNRMPSWVAGIVRTVLDAVL